MILEQQLLSERKTVLTKINTGYTFYEMVRIFVAAAIRSKITLIGMMLVAPPPVLQRASWQQDLHSSYMKLTPAALHPGLQVGAHPRVNVVNSLFSIRRCTFDKENLINKMV